MATIWKLLFKTTLLEWIYEPFSLLINSFYGPLDETTFHSKNCLKILSSSQNSSNEKDIGSSRFGDHFEAGDLPGNCRGNLLEDKDKSIQIKVSPTFISAPFSKPFPSARKPKAGVFKFLLFEDLFREALFSWRTSVNCRTDRIEKEAAFSNFSGVVWTGPYIIITNLQYILLCK